MYCFLTTSWTTCLSKMLYKADIYIYGAYSHKMMETKSTNTIAHKKHIVLSGLRLDSCDASSIHLCSSRGSVRSVFLAWWFPCRLSEEDQHSHCWKKQQWRCRYCESYNSLSCIEGNLLPVWCYATSRKVLSCGAGLRGGRGSILPVSMLPRPRERYGQKLGGRAWRRRESLRC